MVQDTEDRMEGREREGTDYRTHPTSLGYCLLFGSALVLRTVTVYLPLIPSLILYLRVGSVPLPFPPLLSHLQ